MVIKEKKKLSGPQKALIIIFFLLFLVGLVLVFVYTGKDDEEEGKKGNPSKRSETSSVYKVPFPLKTIFLVGHLFLIIAVTLSMISFNNNTKLFLMVGAIYCFGWMIYWIVAFALSDGNYLFYMLFTICYFIYYLVLLVVVIYGKKLLYLVVGHLNSS
jgi:preprotein translocase subunit SecG